MSHLDFLLQTLALAKTCRGICAPNPSVGAIVVRESKVLALGVHHGPGTDHAEVMALKKLAYPIENATLYVSLEPCTHWGKTPPCIDEIKRSGIKTVVYGYSDPNPLTKKRDIEQFFKDNGIDSSLVCVDEISAFYESYHYWTKTCRPFVTAKIAQSLDGKIAGPKGERIELTGEAASTLTHLNRLRTDIILTTAKTVKHDNPKMTARYKEESIKKTVAILDSRLSLTGDEQVFDLAKHVIVFYDKALKKEVKNSDKITYIPLSSNDEGLSLSQLLEILGEMGMHDVWVEAGGALMTHLIRQALINRLYLYIAPVFLGNTHKSAYQTNISYHFNENQTMHWDRYGRDIVGVVDF